MDYGWEEAFLAAVPSHISRIQSYSLEVKHKLQQRQRAIDRYEETEKGPIVWEADSSADLKIYYSMEAQTRVFVEFALNSPWKCWAGATIHLMRVVLNACHNLHLRHIRSLEIPFLGGP